MWGEARFSTRTFVRNDTPPRIYGDVRTVSRRWIPSSLLSIFDTAVCSATSRAISFHREIMGDFAPYLTNEVYGFDSFTYYCAGISRIRRISRGLIDSVVQRFARKKAHPSIDISADIVLSNILYSKERWQFWCKKKGLNYRSSKIISLFTLMMRQKRFIPKFKYLCISDNKIYQCAFICLCKNRVCSHRDNLIRKKHLFYKWIVTKKM